MANAMSMLIWQRQSVFLFSHRKWVSVAKNAAARAANRTGLLELSGGKFWILWGAKGKTTLNGDWNNLFRSENGRVFDFHENKQCTCSCKNCSRFCIFYLSSPWKHKVIGKKYSLCQWLKKYCSLFMIAKWDLLAQLKVASTKLIADCSFNRLFAESG